MSRGPRKSLLLPGVSLTFLLFYFSSMQPVSILQVTGIHTAPLVEEKQRTNKDRLADADWKGKVTMR